MSAPDPLEQLWEALLSGEPARIRAAYAALPSEERQAVLAHLRRMTSAPGWQPGQRRAAQAALDALLRPEV